MQINPPHQVRVALYVLTALLSPVMVYLMAKGYIGTLEMALWGSEVTAVSLMAGFNVSLPEKSDQ
jgi:hypothetical protein